VRRFSGFLTLDELAATAADKFLRAPLLIADFL
jgi:hypothetical protein